MDEALVYKRRERRWEDKIVQDMIVLWYIKLLAAARRRSFGAIAWSVPLSMEFQVQ